MSDAYEKYANIFISSCAGEISELTKARFIAFCKLKFPDEIEFSKTMDLLESNAQAQIARRRTKLAPGMAPKQSVHLAPTSAANREFNDP